MVQITIENHWKIMDDKEYQPMEVNVVLLLRLQLTKYFGYKYREEKFCFCSAFVTSRLRAYSILPSGISPDGAQVTL